MLILAFIYFLWINVPFLTALKNTALPDPEREAARMISSVLGILANLCNNGSTMAFLMCFITMQYPTRRGEETRVAWAQVWIACLVMLTFVEAAVRFQFAADVAAWQIPWFDLFTGASAGIALAMFCGRLASPLIEPPISVLAPLYLYAIIQISYAFWSNKEVVLLMANLCLILKCLLFIVIAWLLSTKHLIFYLERIHKTKVHLESWRNEFRSRATPVDSAAKMA